MMNDTFSEIELRKLDLNLLLVFSALMQEGSVVKASRRLYIGSSAISMALTRLRHSLKDPLFVRAQAGMEPTPRALALWREIEPALGQIAAAVRGQRRFDPAQADLTIRFAAPDDLEFVLIPKLLQKLAKEAPGVRLVVRPTDFRHLLGQLDSGDADLALSATPRGGIERRHKIRPLHRDTFEVLFDRKTTGLKAPLRLADYLKVPHLLLSIDGDLSGPIDERLAKAGHHRQVIAALSHFPTMAFALRSRPTLVNMPATAAYFYAQTYRLERSPLPLSSPDFEVSIAWHARTDVDPAQIWFREVVAQIVENLHVESNGTSLARSDGRRPVSRGKKTA